MNRWLLLLFICLPLFGLDISIQSGQEEGEPYSVLHLRDVKPFECREYRNDFNEIVRVECPVSKGSSLPKINNPHFSFSQTPSLLVISAKTKIALFPIGFNLLYATDVYKSGVKPIKHWTIIGYTKNIPMISQPKSNPNAINLPIALVKESYPFVGGLDLKGNPIKMKNVQDVNDYMGLKKAYAAKEYKKVLYIAKDVLEKYPNTIFANELTLYQIRALHHRGEFEKIIQLSKPFMRQYSNDPNIAEVLAYTANAYSQLGQHTDSDYFYDRLFSEHNEDPFAQQGMYFKAKHLEILGGSQKAAKYYRQALSRTKDVTLASACAFELARIEMGSKNFKRAKEFIDKIVQANPSYFGEVHKQSLKMIEVLEGNNEYLAAAKITQSLIGRVPHKSQEHQKYLKNLGILYSKGGDKTKALKKFNEYIELFPHGESIAEVQRAKDGLFFEKEEPKGAKGEQKYDELIERYGNDSIGKTAMYKKAQLLFKEGKYDAVLKMDNELYKLDTTAYPEANALISKSAAMITQKKLQEGKCSEALSMQKMYKIKLLPKWDGLTFECALNMGNFPVAKSLAQKNSKVQEMESRQQWLYRSTKLHFALGEYKESAKAGNDLTALLKAQKNPPLNEVYRLLFDGAQRSGNDILMVKTIKECETLFGIDFKDLERYTHMVSLGLKRKDDAMVQNYAAKVISLQKRTSTYTQSPFIEFTLAQVLMNQEKNKEALDILRSLDARKLTAEKRSRQHYLIGSLAMKMGRNGEAKTAFSVSIKADKNSAWGKLAKDALGLL
ncbi:MAG TPA: tetratricopeptide repeat protein [Sulfuricurvum sp.]|nr:tetratricopeptide repeat protein [Sulfuricurvum sp.]